MHSAVLITLGSFFFAFSLSASSTEVGKISPNESIVRQSSSYLLNVSPETEEDFLRGIFENNQALFHQLMPEYAIQQNYDETKKSFIVHLKDSWGKFPNPEIFLQKNLKSPQKIKGTMTYIGFYKAKYAYDVENLGGIFVHKIRVHFKQPVGTDVQDFQSKIKMAQNIWNNSMALQEFRAQFGIDVGVSFQFDVETNPKLAHFSVNIADKTRGPYYSEWARNWTPLAIAHEVGHMLGLGDEYETVSGNSDCLRESLMCESWTGQLMKHHYYHIYKRLF